MEVRLLFFFFFQAEDGIRDYKVTGVQTCALQIYIPPAFSTFSPDRTVSPPPPCHHGAKRATLSGAPTGSTKTKNTKRTHFSAQPTQRKTLMPIRHEATAAPDCRTLLHDFTPHGQIQLAGGGHVGGHQVDVGD